MQASLRKPREQPIAESPRQSGAARFPVACHSGCRLALEIDRQFPLLLAILAAVAQAFFGATLLADSPLPPADHWAYRPLQKATPPPVTTAVWHGWSRTPIDRFILAKLSEHNLDPSPPADRRTLLRRVYLDLIGMPPLPEEVDAFLSDDAPDAYERVVGQLLSSPHYGERWARHWMDVVHFAETHGHDQDRPREHAWPYRDFLVRSFNQDKPYARFVQEQVAGDVLFPENPWAVTATGFIAAGPWDESSLMFVQGESVDRLIAHYLDRDDMVTTTMSTFASSSVQCARCHDHKFDPITQEEYYSLQAVFAGIDKANRPYDPDPSTRRKRDSLAALIRQVRQQLNTADNALLDPVLMAEVAVWEEEFHNSAPEWHVLTPTEFASAEGATLTLQPDGSLLSGGKRPDKDTYSVVARTDLPQITGFRIETLTHDSLPYGGPGRQDNANLHLNELIVTIVDPPGNNQELPKDIGSQPDDKEAIEAEVVSEPIQLRDPQADFNQDDYPIAKAVDGDPDTMWGIYPDIRKSHRAVFTVDQPIHASEHGTTLKFELKQLVGAGHLIGRLRLSVTASPPPFGNSVIPDDVLTILATDPALRDDQQRRKLTAHYLKQRCLLELASLPEPQLVFCGTSKFKANGGFQPPAAPRMVHVLSRGNVQSPGAVAGPGALQIFDDLPGTFELEDLADEGARRVALARWLTDPHNVLTWRSIVNRVWHYHFSRGIVNTPNEFGHMGGKPSHPELLDWLATTFLESGGSLKSLHHLIVTSTVYRQSSNYNSPFAEVDRENQYLWRMNRQRLDAEQIRDSLLRISGRLDATMGGPSVKQFIQSKGIHITPKVDYVGFNTHDPANYRRSVYRFLFRTIPDPFMESLDCPDASMWAPDRNESVTAAQALSMLHDKFIVTQCEHLGDRAKLASDSMPTQVEELFRLLLGRLPSPQESTAVIGYAHRHGLANAARFLLNGNEFMFVD